LRNNECCGGINEVGIKYHDWGRREKTKVRLETATRSSTTRRGERKEKKEKKNATVFTNRGWTGLLKGTKEGRLLKRERSLQEKKSLYNEFWF